MGRTEIRPKKEAAIPTPIKTNTIRNTSLAMSIQSPPFLYKIYYPNSQFANLLSEIPNGHRHIRCRGRAEETNLGDGRGQNGGAGIEARQSLDQRATSSLLIPAHYRKGFPKREAGQAWPIANLSQCGIKSITKQIGIGKGYGQGLVQNCNIVRGGIVGGRCRFRGGIKRECAGPGMLVGSGRWHLILAYGLWNCVYSVERLAYRVIAHAYADTRLLILSIM
ncbi:MAG: hypothetical protein BWY29_01040 [Microgenomates group bacterium ADurb.Bin238]|nr:MAG: hypothetical protein BWY29_01040 [Microgenomates group bacterium ADurb.Bin238]